LELKPYIGLNETIVSTPKYRFPWLKVEEIINSSLKI
jgi:hypothetical protein